MTARALRRLGCRRGNVMVHVLVTSIIVMIIAAGLMRLVMVRYVAIQRLNDGGANKRAAEAAVNALVGNFTINGSCSATSLPAGFSRTSFSAACNCDYSATLGPTPVTVQVRPGVGTACRITVNSGS